MLIFDYPSKKALAGCNRPHITGHKREFFANVDMVDGLIAKVR